MSKVVLKFRPSPEHVRTARLVAVAVGRRLGMEETRLEEIRLAVGEVCARAVHRCLAAQTRAPVVVELEDSSPSLQIKVSDSAGDAAGPEEPVALALVMGLADEVDLGPDPDHPTGTVHMSWRQNG